MDNKEEWPLLDKYVKDIIGTYAEDNRVIVWDLYNEPGNSGRREKSSELLSHAFDWAREVDPVQPITRGIWDLNLMSKAELKCLELSDIISFHCYMDAQCTKAKMVQLIERRRPVLCTEWLHRPNGNSMEALLTLFKENNIGIYNWGLVCGKTQTNLSWETMKGNPDSNPTLWQHDILYEDGTPYSMEEANLLKKFSPR